MNVKQAIEILKEAEERDIVFDFNITIHTNGGASIDLFSSMKYASVISSNGMPHPNLHPNAIFDYVKD